MFRYVRPFLVFTLVTLSAVAAHAQWTLVPNPEGGHVTVLRSAGDVLFAGTLDRGLFVSRDGGGSWETVGGDLAHLGIGDLVTAGTPIVAGGYQGELFFSDDDGTSWSEGVPLPERTSVLALARHDGTLFVGTLRAGLLMSADRGGSWTAAGSSGGVLQTSPTYALAVAGEAVVRGGDRGIAVTEDGGAEWERRNDGMGDGIRVNALVVGPGGWFAGTSRGVFRSEDEGGRWREASDGLTARNVEALVLDGGELYAGAADTVYRSSDGGRSWAVAGAVGGSVTTLALHDGRLFAGTERSGAWVSSDRGATWTPANSGLTLDPRFSQALIRGDTILAGSFLGLRLSEDGGETWTAIAGNAFQNDAPRAFVTLGDVLLATGDQGGVRRSTDGGHTWVAANEGLERRCYEGIAVSGGTAVLACGDGAYRSVDSARSWTPVWLDEQPDYYNNPITAVAVFDSTWLAASSVEGIARSTDDGRSWTVSGGSAIRGRIFAFTAAEGALYAAGEPGVFVSTDDGVTWQPTPAAPEARVHDVVAVGTRLFVGTEDGVYASTDGGASWSDASEGLPERGVADLVVDGKRVYVITDGGSILWHDAGEEEGSTSG